MERRPTLPDEPTARSPRAGDTTVRARERVLVTGGRLPVGLELIRKLGRSGHHVVASDTFGAAPGLHSKHAAGRVVTRSPRDETAAFVDDVERALIEHDVDRIVPTFEEVFYLAAHAERLERHAELFAPDFATLALLHDKVRMGDLATRLGIRTPPTQLARSRDELRDACRRTPRFFARPAYGRGGVTLYTNTGPLAGAVSIEDLDPSPQNPFLVQPFVEGEDICSHSVVQHGRVTAHVAYVHPLTLEHAGGIVFESVAPSGTLEIAARIAEATGYHGQLSFDFRQTRDGLFLIECNPRPTSGLTLMPDEMFDRGVQDDTAGRTLVAPPGHRRLLSLAVMRNMWAHWREIPMSVAALASGASDVYADPEDMMPLVYQVVAYKRVIDYRRRQGRKTRHDLMQGYFEDLTWDGEAIEVQRRGLDARRGEAA